MSQNESLAKYSCDICLEDSVPISDFVLCTRLHSFCKQCVTSFAALLIIKQGRTRIPCLLPECRHHFSDSELKSILPAEVVRIYVRLRKMDFSPVIEEEKEIVCPVCGTADPLAISSTSGKCSNFDCQKEICLLCSKLSHVPLTCEQVGSSLRNLVAFNQNEAVIRHCPDCRLACIKEDGCNSMECSNCSAHFCYVCEQIIQEGYIHFTGGKCEQNVDDEILHGKRAKAAKKNTIKEYYDALRLRRKLVPVKYRSWADAVKGIAM